MPKYKRGSGSVYRRGGIWWLKYYVDGKPVYESAKTKDRGEARDQLNVKLGQLPKGATSAQPLIALPGTTLPRSCLMTTASTVRGPFAMLSTESTNI
jgi:hypothetical protein